MSEIVDTEPLGHEAAFGPVPEPPACSAHLGEFPAELFTRDFFRSWELVDRYARARALGVCHTLGLGNSLGAWSSLSELTEAQGWTSDFLSPLRFLVDMLIELDLVDVDDACRLRLSGVLPRADVEALAADCLEADAANAPTLAIIDAAADLYPRVARGEVAAESELFSPASIGRWLDYFDNQNPTYAINNLVAAVAADHRLASEAPEILEIGAGAGSAALALLDRRADSGRPLVAGRYRLTEPGAFLRRRAQRMLARRHPEAPIDASSLDVDVDLGEQGLEPDSLDLVYAVNVLHIARDLDASLRSIHTALAPGGWVVLGEAMRPTTSQPVSTEFVFQLLESYHAAQLDPGRRPNSGFLTPKNWYDLLAAANFDEVEVLPDHASIHEIYPRFSTGVVCARKANR